LVGSLDEELEKEYSQILYKYFIEGESFFIVSSDFCHWLRFFIVAFRCSGSNYLFRGTRFSYTYRNKNLEINESIRLLDEEAMSIIKSLKPEKFRLYLKRSRNTICGRHPILLLINVYLFFHYLKNLTFLLDSQYFFF
jgi:AmmeMemoRadiSam system protein B